MAIEPLQGIPNFDRLEIVKTNTEDLTLTYPFAIGSRSTVTVNHNLGYTPTFMAFVTGASDMILTPSYGLQAGELTQLPTMLIANSTDYGEIFIYFQARADVNNLYLDIINTSGVSVTDLASQPFTFRYYLFRTTSQTGSS